MNTDIFTRLRELGEQGRAADILTLVGAPAGQAGLLGQMLIISGGQAEGQLIDQAFTCLIIEKAANDEWNRPVLMEFDYAGGHYRVFWDKLSRQRSALVLGAGHVSQPLVEMLALIGYTVTVVDDRPDFANTVRFPHAGQVICQDFRRALTELNLAGFGAIIIVTRGHRSDMECLRAVIAQPARYIGMIGSQRRVKIVMNTLAEQGVDRLALARLRAPIGLDIGAETPAEIALSIAAEIVAVSRNGSCQPLSDKWRCK
ncbi:hypothetical protein SCACP_33540 [Sporomusa carbonis]|uniref:XdhC family protein n=1 Tax=Sporomusa carbonis TaxID=3076075 RepID=UPI003A64B976